MAATGNADDSRELSDALHRAVRERVRGIDNAALMFSGGLDSAVLAVIARKYCDLTLYILGLEKSHDLEWGRECAYVLDMPWIEIVPEMKDLKTSVENVIKSHGMRNPLWLSTFVAFDLVLGNVSQETVVCGQGADELFGGYRKYQGMPDPKQKMDADICRLLEREFPAYERMAGNHGKVLLAPYLDHSIVELAGAMPMDRKICGSENKLALRDAAEFSGVPVMMARRQKKAMQYGSGISKMLKRYLKEQGLHPSIRKVFQ